jgi:hypothetical protein
VTLSDSGKNGRFEGTYRLQDKVGKNQRARNSGSVSPQRASVASYCKSRQLTDSFHPDDGRRYVPPECCFLEEPDGVTSQETSFFMVSAVKTSNLTKEPCFAFTHP